MPDDFALLFIPRKDWAWPTSGHAAEVANYLAIERWARSLFRGPQSLHIYSVSGVPSNNMGASGDFCFRRDGGGAGATHIYFNNGGAWIGIA